MVAEQVERARTLWQRTRGLLGRRSLPPSHGLWIERCKAIHTHFMCFTIDVLFINRSGEVVRIFSALKPFRMTPFVRESDVVLELPEGALHTTPVEIGDRLVLEPNS